MATLFLVFSAYALLRAGQGSLYSGIIELIFMTMILICLYISYMLIVVVHETF